MRILRTLLTVGVLAGAVASSTGTASAARADDPATPCKKGGFAQYVDPATSAPFANQGTCVSFVRHGGSLVPVTSPPTSSPIRLGGVNITATSGTCQLSIGLKGLTPGESYTAEVTGGTAYPTDPPQVFTITQIMQYNSPPFEVGDATIPAVSNFLPGDVAQVVLDGQALGSPITVPEGCALYLRAT